MSTILKALRRVEDEKKATRERSLSEQVVTPTAAPRGSSGRVVAVLAGGVATGLAIFYFLPFVETPLLEAEPRAEETVAASSADSEPRTAPAPGRGTSREAAAMDSEIEMIPDVQIVKRLEPLAAQPSRVADEALATAWKSEDGSGRNEPATERRNRAAERRKAARGRSRENEPAAKPPAVPAFPATPLPEPEVSTSLQVASDVPNPSSPSSVSPTRVTTPSAIAAVPPVTAAAPLASQKSMPTPERTPSVIESDVRASEAITPASEETSWVSDRMVLLRAELPGLIVQRTIWHPDADRRVAVVKLEDSGEVFRLRHGDAIGPLVVQEIEPTGVFFSHDGVALRRAVGGR